MYPIDRKELDGSSATATEVKQAKVAVPSLIESISDDGPGVEGEPGREHHRGRGVQGGNLYSSKQQAEAYICTKESQMYTTNPEELLIQLKQIAAQVEQKVAPIETIP